MRFILILICSFFFLQSTNAQVGAKATVDSTHMMIGDQQKLHLDVTFPAGKAILPLVFKKKEDQPIEFLAQTKWDTVSLGSSVQIRKDILFTAWDSGQQVVPAIPIVFLENRTQDTVYTLDIPMEIMAPAVDSVLADIKPIIEEPVIWSDYLTEIALVAFLLLALLAWYFASKFKSKKQLPEPPPVIIPPHKIAFRKLEELKKSKLWQQGKVKEFHSQLTYIIREYLEGRYGVKALEQTTDQILAQMKNQSFDQNLTEKMTTLLQTADLVKFAKAEPPADYHDNALAQGEAFVRATKPALQTQEATIDLPKTNEPDAEDAIENK